MHILALYVACARPYTYTNPALVMQEEIYHFNHSKTPKEPYCMESLSQNYNSSKTHTYRERGL